MSKLEFFCHRPTVDALIGLGIDMGTASSGTSGTNTSKKDDDETIVQKDKTEEHGQAKVKGLLGHGKDRVVFSLKMNMDSVTVYFNKEDGVLLAMLVQESFFLHLKVRGIASLLIFFHLFGYIS